MASTAQTLLSAAVALGYDALDDRGLKESLVYAAQTGGGGGSQDMQVAWTPTNLKLGELMGFVSDPDFLGNPTLPGIMSITFNQAHMAGGAIITAAIDLQTLDFPNLIDVDPTNLITGYVNVANNPKLVSITFPKLVTANNAAVWELSNNPLLTSITIPSFVPPNGFVLTASGNALTVTCVNAILARFVANAGYVSGALDLSGGTNAAPSGQGILDKAILVGRGVTVSTN